MLKDLLRNYDTRLRPDYLGPPVEVTVDATVLSFTSLDALNMVMIELDRNASVDSYENM